MKIKEVDYELWVMAVGLVISFFISAIVSVTSLSEEYYEFCERGFYYIDAKRRKFSIRLLKAVFSGNL